MASTERADDASTAEKDSERHFAGAGSGAAESRPLSASQRHVFYFKVSGLSVRDELLLRSMVCVLDKKTHHEWRCRESRPQLAIVHSKNNPGPENISNPADSSLAMMVGDMGVDEGLRLRLPLHPADLEAKLNRAGSIILGRLAADEPSTETASSPHEPVPSHAHEEKKSIPADPQEPGWNDRLQLSRWPAAPLLASPRHVKAATLLLKMPMTMSKICEFSGLTQDECTRFIEKLRQNMLLQSPDTKKINGSILPDAANNQARIGLLARIRLKLGLKP